MCTLVCSHVHNIKYNQFQMNFLIISLSGTSPTPPHWLARAHSNNKKLQQQPPLPIKKKFIVSPRYRRRTGEKITKK